MLYFAVLRERDKKPHYYYSTKNSSNVFLPSQLHKLSNKTEAFVISVLANTSVLAKRETERLL